jgi:steroid 5-alpha reductase family enzyme
MLTVVKVCAGCNAAGYVLTAALETHKLTDLVGCGSFVASAVALTVKAGGPTLLFKTNPRAMVLNGLVMFWGARLGSYLFQRVLQIGEDKVCDLYSIHTFQAIRLFSTSKCQTSLNSSFTIHHVVFTAN